MNSLGQTGLVNERLGQSSQKGPTDSSTSFSSHASRDSSQNAPSRLMSDKGDGRSLREKFNVDTHTGGVSFRIPIHTSPGRNGFAPSLELVHDSGSASSNGVFGPGWRLTGVDTISRKSSVRIPLYDDDEDIFVHSGLGDLVPVIPHGSSDQPIEWDDSFDGIDYRVRLYRPHVESTPIRVERWTSHDDLKNMHWKTIASGNVTTLFGLDSSSRISHPTNQTGQLGLVFSWLEREVYDHFGNHMVFSYKAECPDALAASVANNVYEALRTPTSRATQRYLKSIKYGNKYPNRDIQNWEPLQQGTAGEPSLDWMFEVVLDYGDHRGESPTTREDPAGWALRPDPFSVHTSGDEIRTYRQCQRVLMFHHFEELGCPDYLVAATEFIYESDPKSGASVLRSSVHCGYQLDPSTEKQSCIRMPPTEFVYSASPDVKGTHIEEFEVDLAGLSTADVEWVDLNGDGTPGILAKVAGGGWYYHPNNSSESKPAIGGPSLMSYIPSLADSDDWSFEDLTGNGQLDVVFNSTRQHVHGFYERMDNRGWLSFVPMESFPTDWSVVDPAMRKVDLTGNGHADILRLTPGCQNELVWYPSLGRQGYGGRRSVAGELVIPFGEDKLVVLCDMSGDGLSDIAIIENSCISYWPNLGHGRFGTKVVMGNSPLLAKNMDFSPRRIRTADITGSGTADLIYLAPNGDAYVYYNQSGNTWSDGHVISGLPPLDGLCAVDVFDISGRGTQCLVWTSDHFNRDHSPGSTTVKFIDLMGGCKPGLLTKCSNGIGAEVEVTYRSSTHYHFDDKRAGNPWTAPLPFPINCVERVINKDRVSQTSSTMRYAYHNGSYDSVERHFRGFQMVETWDAEDFSVSSANRFHRPPVHTKTWFYVGCQQIDDMAVLPGSFRTDQRQQSPLSAVKLSCQLPLKEMTPEEVQDSYRALAGIQRRQEVFGDDESSKSAIPYAVTQQTFEVIMGQKIYPGQRYGRFRVNSREQLKSHYEREPSEALAQHTVTLQIDEYGNICKQAVVSYGKASGTLQSVEDQQRQQETVIHYTETDYTNAIESLVTSASTQDGYFQAPLPSEVRQYRVFPGSDWAWNSTTRYSFETLAASICMTSDIAVDEQLPNSPVSSQNGQKQLISKSRTIYSTANLTSHLGLHKLEPLSVEYQSYQLAFTRKRLEGTLKDDKHLFLDAHELNEELARGGYVQLDQNDEWWAPSPRMLFKDNIDDDGPDSSLFAARSQFYIPNAQIDYNGNVFHQKMDQYSLLPVKSRDAVKNETTFENNYVHLRQGLTIDANGNRTQTAYDPCGRAVGVAVMAKDTEALGDSLDGFSVEMSPASLQEFLDHPSGPIAARLLGHAGRRTIYQDYFNPEFMMTSGNIIPSFQVELVRDTHYRDTTTPLQIAVSFTYRDGYGEAIQKASLSGKAGETEQWQFSGWVIHDNKHQPVKEFLAFTASTHDFQPQTDNPFAPATTILRDPLDRVVAVLNADKTWSKTRFSPWAHVDFDAGDTVDIEDPATDSDVGTYFAVLDRSSYFPTWCHDDNSPVQAVTQSRAYHDTPTITYKDSLGHDIVVENDNGPLQTGRDKRVTRRRYDFNGNVAEIQDARGRVVSATQYDLLGRPLHRINMDSGSHWQLLNCLGYPILTWSSRGDRKRIVHDKLHRVQEVWVQLPSEPSSELMVSKNVYGEGQPDARKKNLNGQLYQCYDQSGLRTNKLFDFHGNRIESSIRYAVEYKRILDWRTESSQLEAKEYVTRTSFNSVGQELHLEDFSGESVWKTYDAVGRLKTLKSLSVDGITITSVEAIAYSEDDKIISVDYGNGSLTTHKYDKKSRRLNRTCTKRKNDGTRLEDIVYTYDCLGRVIDKTNQAEQTVYFKNNVVSSSQTFQYDALGQLLESTGREQVDTSKSGRKRLCPYSAASGKSNSIPGPGCQMIEYVETYRYDLAGNISQMQHRPRKATDYSGWTRKYSYTHPSAINPRVACNRLSGTAVGKVTETYQYNGDAGRNGCITFIPGYSVLTWDHNDRLRSFSSQRVSEGVTPETTWYVYDSEGNRVRKITERSVPKGSTSTPTRSKETRYFPLRDIFTTYGGDGCSLSREITTASASDPRIAKKAMSLVEYDSNTRQQVIRYQMSDNLELDNHSHVISYEEYSPYGSSTYQARTKGVPRKYRFMGYKRDSESGLYICGKRLYVPWIGRWMSPDPIGTADGLNRYAYVGNDPVNFEDPQGTSRRLRAAAPSEPKTIVPEPTMPTDPELQQQLANRLATHLSRSIWNNDHAEETFGFTKSLRQVTLPAKQKKNAPKPATQASVLGNVRDERGMDTIAVGISRDRQDIVIAGNLKKRDIEVLKRGMKKAKVPNPSSMFGFYDGRHEQTIQNVLGWYPQTNQTAVTIIAPTEEPQDAQTNAEWHAEVQIMSYAAINNKDISILGISKPACSKCADVLKERGVSYGNEISGILHGGKAKDANATPKNWIATSTDPDKIRKIRQLT